MPAINARSDVLFGRDCAWLTDDLIMGAPQESGYQLATAPSRAGPWTPVANTRGASAVAGNGVGGWLAHLVGYGVFGPSGFIGTGLGLGADYQAARALASPDGTVPVLLDYNHGRGLQLVAADGSVVEYPDVYPQAQVAVLNRTQALFWDWMLRHLESVGGLSVPDVVSGPVYWPTVFQTRAGEQWVLYHSTSRILLHPFDDATRGYAFPAGFYPHARLLSDGRVKVAWAFGPDDGAGEERIIDLAHDPRVSLVDAAPPDAPIPAINRTLWFGWFTGTPTSGGGWTTTVDPRTLPGNCYIVIPGGEIKTMDGQRVGWFTAGSPEGDSDAIDHAIAMARSTHPGDDVLVYWPRGAWKRVPVGARWTGLEAYRHVDESEADFDQLLRNRATTCPNPALIVQAFTNNDSLTKDLTSVMRVCAGIARDMGCPLFMFNGSGRATGLHDHPEMVLAWQRLAQTVTAPSLPAPSPPVQIPPVPVPVPQPPAVPSLEGAPLMNPKTVAVVGPGAKYASVNPTTKQLTFDRTEIGDWERFELSKPDDRFQLKSLSTRLILGVDVTQFGSNDIRKLFTLTDESKRGNYESFFVGKTPHGLVVAFIEYIDQGVVTKPFASPILTVVEQ